MGGGVPADAEMTALAIKGSVDATDLAYIRNTLTKLEVLDLSMTDMVPFPVGDWAFIRMTVISLIQH